MSAAALAVVAATAAGIGTALLLSRLRWFRRVSLAARLRPFHAVGSAGEVRRQPFTSLRQVVAPLARGWGDGLGRIVGVQDDAGTRLVRIGSPLLPTDFRVRQLGWSILAFALGALTSVALDLPPIVGLAVLVGLPVLASLVVEQRLTAASDEHQRRIFGELPVVAEQLGMLLDSGYSLGAALERLATRGSGVIAGDLGTVLNRVRQGLAIDVALTEWSSLAGVDELDRLVHILTLHQAATDLGPLISAEARVIRREAHRRLVAQMEQRAQLVWVPVTVAALLPGAIFLAVPFADALRLVSS